jgi:hypothetical protein
LRVIVRLPLWVGICFHGFRVVARGGTPGLVPRPRWEKSFATFVDPHPANKKTEILNYASKQWNAVADYPFSSRDEISHYATSSTENSVYIIGGYTSPATNIPIIAQYKNDEWHNVGNLKQTRHSHGAITSGSLTMVIGGYSYEGQRLQTEVWELETLANRIIAPIFYHNYQELGLFLVDIGYCKKT